MSIRETFATALEALQNKTMTAQLFSEAVSQIGVRDALFSTAIHQPELWTTIAEIEVEENAPSVTFWTIATMLSGNSWTEVQIKECIEFALKLDENYGLANLLNYGLTTLGVEDTIGKVTSAFSNMTAEDHLVHAETLAQLR